MIPAAGEHCLFREGARAAIWYSRNLHMKDTRVEVPKMFRDMDGMVLENVVLTGCSECCWHAVMRSFACRRSMGIICSCTGRIYDADGFRLNGNYSFQYCRNAVIRNAEIHSKDAFWNTEDVTVYDSVVTGIPGLAFQELSSGELPHFRHAGAVLRGKPGSGELHARRGCGSLL